MTFYDHLHLMKDQGLHLKQQQLKNDNERSSPFLFYRLTLFFWMIFRSCLYYRYPPLYVMKHEFISPPLQRDDDHNSINEKCEFYYARVRRICGQVSLGYLWGVSGH